MALITRLERQKKRSDRYSVYLDGVYAFSVSDLFVLKYHLASDVELNEDLIRELKQADQKEELYNYALRLISRQERTLSEMRMKMEKRCDDPEVINHVLMKMKEYNFLNDEEYIQRYLSFKTAHGYWYLVQKLKERGLDRHTVEEKVREFLGEKGERMAAERALETRKSSWDNLPAKKKQEKIFRFLRSRGFSNPVIFSLINSE